MAGHRNGSVPSNGHGPESVTPVPVSSLPQKGQNPRKRAPTKPLQPSNQNGEGHGSGKNGTIGRASAIATAKPSLVRQANGRGALLSGGVPGNRGNPAPLGSPPSLIRAQLRGSYDQRKGFLTEVVEGVVMVQTQVPLAAVIPHVACAACAGPVVAKNVEDVFLLMIPAKQSPSVKDRLAALDQMARYGMGTLKEVSVDSVKERVSLTLDVIRRHVKPDVAEILFRAIEPVWAA